MAKLNGLMFALVLSLAVTACTSDKGGGSAAVPKDVSDYSKLTSEKSWMRYLDARESEFRELCPGESYSSYYCNSNSVPVSLLNKRLAALDRYLKAVKAAKVSGRVEQRTKTSLEYKVKYIERGVVSLRADLKQGLERKAKQDVVIAQVNAQTSCKISRDEASDTNELVFADCNLLVNSTDSALTTGLLDKLSQTAVDADRDPIRTLVDRYKRTGAQVEKIASIQKSLINKGQLTFGDSQTIQISGPGNPFGGFYDTAELASYATAVNDLSVILGIGVDSCPAPACNQALFSAAKSIKANYTPGSCGGGGYATSPSSEHLNTWRKSTPPSVLKTLGIDFSAASADLDSNLDRDILSFSNLFSYKNIVMSVSPWRIASNCPEAAPLYYAFQETRAIVNLLSRLGTANSKEVREIRFTVSNSDSTGHVTASRMGSGIRLEIPALETYITGRNVESVRDEVLNQIPGALAGVAASSN